MPHQRGGAREPGLSGQNHTPTHIHTTDRSLHLPTRHRSTGTGARTGARLPLSLAKPKPLYPSVLCPRLPLGTSVLLSTPQRTLQYPSGASLLRRVSSTLLYTKGCMTFRVPL
mmetsp:Transcript_62775/g.111947  ORF Transcript_62775/g.111947 Transcript_62775/m.111947 type:complete len:113 (-) Transcript_62775:2338-2676(-)